MRWLPISLVLLSCADAPGTPSQLPPPVGGLVLRLDPMVRGEPARLVVEGAAPGQRVSFGGSVRGTGAGPCVRGLCLDLVRPVLLGEATADARGRAVLTVTPPASGGLAEVSLQAAAFAPDGLSRAYTVPLLDPGQDHAALTAGVSAIDTGGALPSVIVSPSRRSFPVITTADGRAVVSAARAEAGRVVLGSHESFWLGMPSTGTLDEARLFRNVLDWAGGPSPVVGVTPGMVSALPWLLAQGYDARQVALTELPTIDVLLLDTSTTRTPADLDAIQAWVSDGGGLVAGGHAWWWGQSNTGVATRHPGNQLLGELGLLLSDAWTRTGRYDVSPTPLPPTLGAARALEAAAAHATTGPALPPAALAQASVAVGDAMAIVPLDWPDFDEPARALLAAVPPVVPTATAPVRPATQPLQSLWLRVRSWYDEGLPAQDVTAHPAAADFPGAVDAAAPRITRVLTLDATYPGRDGRYLYSGAGAPVWRSTGLYAAPGELVTVTVPQGWAARGLTVQIGAHTDTLWGADAWHRVPDVVRAWPVDAPTIDVASAFGGPIYLTVPGGAALGPGTVTIAGAVESPTFVRGTTTALAWSTLRTSGAPWGELHGDGVVLTLPTSTLSGLTDPSALVAFWDEVADAQADLAAISRDRVREERLVTDRQISAGWMHSGYPIMAHLASAADFADLADLSALGDWGAFHELGHNHQWADWLLPGTTETTCNLWSLYTMEHVVGLPPRTGHPALAPADRAARVATYLANGADFRADWSVWTALETHLQLQEAFGWQLFVDLNAWYLSDPPGAGPTTDQGRIDRFVERTSALAGVDLGPFYLAWGVPVSPSVLAAIAALPPWTADPMNP